MSEVSLSEQISQIQSNLESENIRLVGSIWIKTTKGTGNIFILDLDGNGVSEKGENDMAENEKFCLSVGAGCGNGVVESSEQCDDGNTDDTDACLSSCAYRPLSKDDFLSELINQLENEESDNINKERVNVLFRQFLQGLQGEGRLQ